MFIFEKRTQIPVVIKNRNPKLASYILSQYGGPDGELGAGSEVSVTAVCTDRQEGNCNTYRYRCIGFKMIP